MKCYVLWNVRFIDGRDVQWPTSSESLKDTFNNLLFNCIFSALVLSVSGCGRTRTRASVWHTSYTSDMAVALVRAFRSIVFDRSCGQPSSRDSISLVLCWRSRDTISSTRLKISVVWKLSSSCVSESWKFQFFFTSWYQFDEKRNADRIHGPWIIIIIVHSCPLLWPRGIYALGTEQIASSNPVT